VSELPVVNVVLGTAGHIDHGKTSLVKRLTGIDADRLKEEKARGMTIDIGYAHMVVDSRLHLGIIDVPGHERFVKNMVAGATGVGVVLLIVAADDGIMPQTREHLDILELLGIRLGAAVLNKVDLVDGETADLAEEELRDFLKGSFLDGAPVVRVSCVTGAGFDRLEAVIAELVRKAEAPPSTGPFYLPVQRSFAAEGFGTVVTGVPMRGRVRIGDALEVQPSGRAVRVRGIEAYGRRLEEGRAGHRIALNLADVAHGEIGRGDVVATPGYFRAWPAVTARLKYLASRKVPLRSQAPVHFHVGTSESLARAIVLDRAALAPGETGYVQFRLEQPLIAAPGDRFIVRDITPNDTIGGGVVLQGTERRLKTNRPWAADEARRWERLAGAPEEALDEALRAAGLEPATLKEAAAAAYLLPAEAEAALSRLLPDGRARAVGQGDRFVSGEAFAALLGKVEEALRAFHGGHPLAEGMDRVELRTASGASKPVFDAALEALEAAGRVQAAGALARLPGFSVGLSAAEQAALAELERRFRDGGAKPPSAEEACAGLDPARAPALYRLLVQRGVLVEVLKGDIVFHREALERIRGEVVAEIREKGELQPSPFRERIGTTRKYLIPLLEYFDKMGLTVRQENARVLREHGRGAKGGS
jgi:selenocysteine-specific elongation factor